MDGPCCVVVIGASAGGLPALTEILRGLPRETPAALFVVLHFPAHTRSHLPEILGNLGSLPAAHAVDGEAIAQGRIRVAPPGELHLVLEPGVVRLVEGPREMRARPAADALFRTAAAVYGARVIGVILSGMDGDGAAGIRHVREGGGVTVVQDPADARYSGMPDSALEGGPVDHCLPAAAIGPLLARLARSASEPRAPSPAPEADAPVDAAASEATATATRDGSLLDGLLRGGALPPTRAVPARTPGRTPGRTPTRAPHTRLPARKASAPKAGDAARTRAVIEGLLDKK